MVRSNGRGWTVPAPPFLSPPVACRIGDPGSDANGREDTDLVGTVAAPASLSVAEHIGGWLDWWSFDVDEASDFGDATMTAVKRSGGGMHLLVRPRETHFSEPASGAPDE